MILAAGLAAIAGCGVSENVVVGEPAASQAQAGAEFSLAAIDGARMAQLRPGDVVRLDLGAEAGVIEARTLRVEQLDEGRVSWTGAVIGTGDQPEGEATLIINGPMVTGSVRTAAGATYRIRPTEQGNVVEATDHATMAPD
jgi:hypothetical protein